MTFRFITFSLRLLFRTLLALRYIYAHGWYRIEPPNHLNYTEAEKLLFLVRAVSHKEVEILEMRGTPVKHRLSVYR